MKVNDPVKEIQKILELEVKYNDKKIKIIDMNNFKRKDVEFTLLITLMNSPMLNKIVYNIVKNEIYILGDNMQKDNAICFELDYGDRSKYIHDIVNINKLVGYNGQVLLGAYNNPYDGSELYLVVEDINDEIYDMFEKEYVGKLKKSVKKSSQQFYKDIGDRKLNLFTLSPLENEEDVRGILEKICLFPERTHLEKKEYKYEKRKRKKIFISYSHSDSIVVEEVVTFLERKNIPLWIDKVDIDYGDNILCKMTEGLQDCDIGIVFLSKNFKKSYYGRHELNSIFNDVIQEKKKFLPIKIDDVEVEEIIPTLGNFKYLDKNLEKDYLKRIHNYIKKNI